MVESLVRSGLARAAAVWSPVAVRLQAHRIILCFHSVRDPNRQTRGYVGYRSRMNLEDLDALLAWLKTWASIVSLDSLMENEGTGWRVALTFDDGYVDNLRSALPLLESYQAPMTWFVCTRFVQEPDSLPWWDLIDYIRSRVRGTISFTYDGEHYEYNMRRAGERERFLREQRPRFYVASSTVRRRRQNALEAAVRKETGTDLPPNGFARPKEVARTADSPWITIGAHTHTHQNLGACSIEVASREVDRGRALLERWTDQYVRWFAYPFGAPSAWTPQIAQLVEKKGFKGSFTLTPDYIGAAPHCQAIPRTAVESQWGIPEVRARIFAGDLYRWARTLKKWVRLCFLRLPS